MFNFNFNSASTLSLDSLSLNPQDPSIPFQFGKTVTSPPRDPPSARVSTPTSKSSNAGGTVYRIAELRQRIIGLLSSSEKVCFMRVGRAGMEDIVGEIYEKIQIGDLQKLLASSSVSFFIPPQSAAD